MTSKRLYVVNESSHVSLIDAKKMVEAVNLQLRDNFKPLWGTERVVVEYHSGDLANVQATAPPGSWVIGILDNSDQAGALGWHSVDDQDRIYGEIFAEPSLQAGSTALTGTYAISSVLSHEACEIEGDVFCNLFADSGRGYSVAYETCDPVEADVYDINGVAVSNFVLPSWFDPNALPGTRLDYLNRTKAPFSMSPGGYWVQMASGQETQKFGEVVNWETEVGFDVRADDTIVFSPEMPEWKRELKMIQGRNLIRRQRIQTAA